jgi:hypothetical protein
LVHELESLSQQYPVAIGGHGAESIAHLLKQGRAELIRDLEALHMRLARLNSLHMNQLFKKPDSSHI